MLPPAFYGRPKTFAFVQTRTLANSWRSATADCTALERAYVLLEAALAATGADEGAALEITSADFSPRPSLRVAGQPNFDRAKMAALGDCRAVVKNVCDGSYELEFTIGATHPYAVALRERTQAHSNDAGAVRWVQQMERVALDNLHNYERLRDLAQDSAAATEAVEEAWRFHKESEAAVNNLRLRLNLGLTDDESMNEALNSEHVMQQFIGHPYNMRLRGECDEDDDEGMDVLAPDNEELQVRLNEATRRALFQLTRDKVPMPQRIKAKRDAKKEAYREACNFVVYWTVARDRAATWREMSDADGKAWLALEIDGVPHKPNFQDNGHAFRGGNAVMTWPDERNPTPWTRLSLPKRKTTFATEAQGVLSTLGHNAGADQRVWSSYRYACGVCGQNSYFRQQRNGPCAFCRAPSASVTMHMERTIICLATPERPRMLLRHEWGAGCVGLAGSGEYNLPWHHGDPRYVKSSMEIEPGKVVDLEVPMRPLDIATKRKQR